MKYDGGFEKAAMLEAYDVAKNASVSSQTSKAFSRPRHDSKIVFHFRCCLEKNQLQKNENNHKWNVCVVFKTIPNLSTIAKVNETRPRDY